MPSAWTGSGNAPSSAWATSARPCSATRTSPTAASPSWGAFDCDPFKVGEEISGLEVLSTRRLKDVVAENGIEIGLITTPANRAQRAANFLIAAGIKGIINYSPAMLTVPPDVTLEYVDFFHHFYAVAFSMTLDRLTALP